MNHQLIKEGYIMSKENQAQQENQQKFNIKTIYTKSSSFEVPNAPQIFESKEKPEIQMEMRFNQTQLQAHEFEVIMRIQINATVNKQTYYTLKLEQAGIFQIENIEPETIKQLLGGHCPNILYNYSRKIIADLTSQGNVQTLHITPVNFEAVYMQQQQQKASTGSEEAKTLH